MDERIKDAMSQADAQFESIKEMVEELQTADAAENEDAKEDARRRIEEDALCVEVRSDWSVLGADLRAAEYTILLCTGGPAVRIIGELTEYGEPETASLECQDWFTPWTAAPLLPGGEEILLAYARCFYFGG